MACMVVHPSNTLHVCMSMVTKDAEARSMQILHAGGLIPCDRSNKDEDPDSGPHWPTSPPGAARL